MIFMLSISMLILIILLLFFFSSKNLLFDSMCNSSFECGFTSYFFSRFSFSMHYFMIGLIFLFLDLELCYIMPFLLEDSSSILMDFFIFIFILSLILGLMEEWRKDLLNWKF